MLAALGFSLNNLSLFGLVLAIGIVVDDAIVVVETVERNIREGLSPRDAAYKTMEEVGGALVAIALVLSAVFIPWTFLIGLAGSSSGSSRSPSPRRQGSRVRVADLDSGALRACCSAARCKSRRYLLRPGPIFAFFNGFNRAFEWISSATLTDRQLLRTRPWCWPPRRAGHTRRLPIPQGSDGLHARRRTRATGSASSSFRPAPPWSAPTSMRARLPGAATPVSLCCPRSPASTARASLRERCNRVHAA